MYSLSFPANRGREQIVRDYHVMHLLVKLSLLSKNLIHENHKQHSPILKPDVLDYIYAHVM